LLDDGRRVVVLDDLSEGHAAAAGDADLVEARFGDRDVLDTLLAPGDIGHVVHMAASCAVGESMADPAKYYENNLEQSMVLLNACRAHGVDGIVFSSTAAVYGEPDEVPITESHPLRPTNPYGQTKLAFEHALKWYRQAYGVKWVALRYFNAAGAHLDGSLGEDHDPELHLIPRLLTSAREGGPPTPIFGEDYPTTDGTCVRDYVHVMDLAEAHVLALGAMERGAVDGEAFNLGNGGGFSVREVADAVAKVTGSPPPTESAPRRAGDPAILVASSEAARRSLGWIPAYPELEKIIASAWDWHRTHPHGYESAT
jgi:UDP-glucose 4-epimerase